MVDFMVRSRQDTWLRLLRAQNTVVCPKQRPSRKVGTCVQEKLMVKWMLTRHQKLVFAEIQRGLTLPKIGSNC